MKSKKYLRTVVSMVAIVLALGLAGCGGGVEFTYRVGGTASEAKVRYTNADGDIEEAVVGLPWEETIRVGNEFSFEFEAVNESGSGTVTCEALVGDDPLGEGTGKTSISCYGNFSKKGGSLSTSFSSVPGAVAPAATPTPSASEHIDLGMTYVEQGKYNEAVAEFQIAIELEPDDAEAHRGLGTAYGKQGEWEEAAAAYEKAIELDPDFGEAYGDVAWPYVELGRFSEAIAAGEKAIELVPDNAVAHNNLGVAYNEQDRPEDAIAEYQEAIRINPDYDMAHLNLGVVYKEQGRLEEAVAEYQEAIRINPDYDMAHYNLGNVYYEQGRLEEAVAEYQEAIRINPDYVKAHLNLGFAYYEHDQLEEAIAEYKEVIRVEPDYAGAHKNLGLAYREQGRTKEAIAGFETYLQILPDAPDRGAVEQEIAKLKEETAGVEYRNAAGGYSLVHPEGWYYAEKETEVTLAPSREDYEAPSLRSPLITFIVWPLAEATENLGLDETAAPVEFLQVMAGRIEAETGEMESVEIAGYPAAVAATSGSMEGTPYRGDLIITLVEERLFLAEALAPSDQWDDFRPNFVDMVNSLSFFEPSGEYRNASGGYGLRYPEGWYYEETSTQVEFAESKEALEVAGEETVGILFNAGPLTSFAENLGVPADTSDPVVVWEAMADLFGAEGEEMATFEIGGYPAAASDISGTDDDTPFEGGMAVVLVEERLLYGVALAPPDQWEAFSPTFVDMVNSLSFFEPQE